MNGRYEKPDGVYRKHGLSGDAILLEVLWAPLYHGLLIGKDVGTRTDDGIAFFAGAWRSDPVANAIDHLRWPERFECWEIEFVFQQEPERDVLADLVVNRKSWHRLPLTLYRERQDRRHSLYFPLEASVRIETEQHFSATLRNTHSAFDGQVVYCMLNGYRLRSPT